MATSNETEQKIHRSGVAGNNVSEKLIEMLKKQGEAGKVHPEFASQATRTDLWYEEKEFGKTCEIKYSMTNRICPDCKQILGMHQKTQCKSVRSFIPTHKNCQQRFHEARGKICSIASTDYWEEKRWSAHFLYFDLCDEGSDPIHNDLISGMQKLAQKFKIDIRVKIYTYHPRQNDLDDIARWIRTP